ncbi:MAG: hypothetical protein ACRDJP_10270, partial [Actinomycetota bacterium]
MTRKIFLGVVAAGLCAALAAPVGAAKSPACAPLDGVYIHDEDHKTVSWVGGRAAPGITIVSASGNRIVFSVANGFRLDSICVSAGGKAHTKYNIDTVLPKSGPATVTITKAGRGIEQISFDTVKVPVCPTVEAPDVSFDEPLFIDRQRAGGEPVSIVGQDGSISVSAHAGTTHIYKNPTAAPGAGDFAQGYFNQTLNWRSVDGGRTWDYIGQFGTEMGPHSITSTGFSDPDFAMDQGGNIYNVEIDLANDAVFMSPDDGQSYPIAHPVAASGDRPWLTALEANEVFLYVNLPRTMWQSENGGISWAPVLSPPVTAKSHPDPLDPDNAMIGPVGTGRFAIGVENENATPQTVTWTTKNFGPHSDVNENFFDTIALDRAGNVYQATAGGYSSANDVTPNGDVSFMYYERATGDVNPSVIDIPTPPGDALWPWVIAGDDGRAVVVWYQNLAGKPNEFYIYAAYTHNAHGTTVTCTDGSTRYIPPQFTVENASGRPFAIGKICLNGTNCNASLDFEGGDRRLGDFFTVNFDHEGNIFITSADTTLKNPIGGPKPVGNPIFIRQNGGDPILAQPDQVRPSRCLFP